MLNKIIESIRPGDTFVIWKLYRLCRPLGHLITLCNDLLNKKILLKSINDPIDTSSAQSKLAFNILASLAEFEKGLIRIISVN